MYLLSQQQLNQYAQQFEDCTLPIEEWTHELHLLMALHTLTNHPTDSFAVMRKKITQYNTAVGKVNSDTHGYHETMTAFWLWAVRDFCQQLPHYGYDEATADELLFKEELTNRNLWLKYYSKELMFSKEARQGFIYPDIEPFP
jgi:hypothetical protein